MKPSKTTTAYLAAMALTVLFDLVFVGLTSWVLAEKIKGISFIPEWFFPFCIAGAVVNGVFFLLTVVMLFLKKR